MFIEFIKKNENKTLEEISSFLNGAYYISKDYIVITPNENYEVTTTSKYSSKMLEEWYRSSRKNRSIYMHMISSEEGEQKREQQKKLTKELLLKMAKENDILTSSKVDINIKKIGTNSDINFKEKTPLSYLSFNIENDNIKLKELHSERSDKFILDFIEEKISKLEKINDIFVF